MYLELLDSSTGLAILNQIVQTVVIGRKFFPRYHSVTTGQMGWRNIILLRKHIYANIGSKNGNEKRTKIHQRPLLRPGHRFFHNGTTRSDWRPRKLIRWLENTLRFCVLFLYIYFLSFSLVPLAGSIRATPPHVSSLSTDGAWEFGGGLEKSIDSDLLVRLFEGHPVKFST